ncbi:unnamed protein product [Schistocephalus solidus]|uniref:BACK domain-containing protein n=1 Tax=Schistocephalus solidus TaxID=70667 RepID=A0A183TTD5_SCHSO|nr:unnamed protein product [Schistocephalus solidus]
MQFILFSPRPTCREKDSVFVVGGLTSRQGAFSKCVMVLACWRKRAPLAIGRHSHAAAVVKTAGGGEGRTVLGVFGGENEGGSLSSCEVYDVSRDSVANMLVNYVYTGQAELTQANVRAVVMFARIIKLPVLENWGQHFMANRVTFENLATTWDFASSLNIDLLKEKCLSLMRQHFEEFVATEQFLRMPANTVLNLLRSDALSVESEEQVIGAISRWVGSADRADEEKLKVHAPAMLKEVQWHQTTFECRSRLMERYPIFQKSPECP